MKYKLYTKDLGDNHILEEPGDGPVHFYEARSLEEAEAKSRRDVQNFNDTLKPWESPREFVRVESEDDWCAAHPEIMATPEAVMDFFFMHWLSDDSKNFEATSRDVLKTLYDVMTVFKGERSKGKRDLAVQKLEEWLDKKGCTFEANMVRKEREFSDYSEELRDALCGYLPSLKLRQMFADNGRWDKNGHTK